jgi:hypothetical protein
VTVHQRVRTTDRRVYTTSADPRGQFARCWHCGSGGSGKPIVLSPVTIETRGRREDVLLCQRCRTTPARHLGWRLIVDTEAA